MRVELWNYGAWALSIVLLVWMLVDTFRVETSYEEDLLTSSLEGEIEKEIEGVHVREGAA